MCKMKDNLVKQALFSYNYIVERKAVKVETTKKQKRKNENRDGNCNRVRRSDRKQI